ncbi:N-acetylneuraminate synthase family protein [Aliarcobacter butzleri]|uniref:N-acetylneuraminate synthase family protein n=1 Tax=Aliarcobacter butzleri TaxID=28197 RepID=UPI001EDF372A|nr:N-acetylneuraminate synthase family protein [Aliarcobacter butzleri]MCG3674640.1 N-acetylneuraminate synthase family protein [Aliarcobacter butzleri]
MKVGIILLCRYNSSRLSGKILKQINGRSVLGHILDRLNFLSHNNQIIVATSDEKSDDDIEEFCRYSNVDCYRGSLDNVADRFLSCAKYYRLDYAIRINGDNIFTPWDVLTPMIAIAKTNNYQFVTNVVGRTFPKGMSIEIVNTKFYADNIDKFSSEDKEHVTLWFYKNSDVCKKYEYLNDIIEEAKGLDLALDTQEDFENTKYIMSQMNRYPATYSFKEIIQLATKKDKKSTWKGKYGPMLIAEIGGNHEGNFEVAKELTRQAISTGVDFIKFQLYTGDTLVSPVESPTRNEHFKKFELSKEQHIELAKICQNAGIGYMASTWDLDMLDWIDEYSPIYKIGSGDLTAWPIIKEFAKRGKPIILSTGLATMDEVLQTISYLQKINNVYKNPNYLCILQCTSMYPIEYKDANLNVMKSLKDVTGLAVGYSDHTEGIKALEIATAMGAKVLEFHFTDSREGKVFRDHKVSLTPSEVVELQQKLKDISDLKGSYTKQPQKIEIEQDHVTSFRRALYLKRDLEVGEEIKEEDIACLRPNHGLDARNIDRLIGRKLANKQSANKQINIKDIK